MNEEKETQSSQAQEEGGSQTEATQVDTEELSSVQGSSRETLTLLERTERATEARIKANEQTEALLKRQEDLKAKELLGGQAEGGTPVKVKEETPSEYRDRVMSGKL